MNSLKPLILLAILGGVGFGVYRSLNKGSVEPPAGTDTSVTGPPEIKLGIPGGLAEKNTGTKNGGPNLLRAAPGSTAPPFSASDSSHDPTPGAAAPFSAESARNATADPAPPFNPGFGSGSGSDSDRAVGFSGAAGPVESGTRAATFAAAWATIQPKLAAGRLSESLHELTAWRNHPTLTPSEQQWITSLLGELAGTVIYSRDHLMAAPHRVKPGERLEDIALKYKVTAELLAKINGIDPSSTIQPGDEIKVVPGPFSAIVEVGGKQLTLLLDGRYAGNFPLAGVGSALDAKLRTGEPIELSISQKTTAPIYNAASGEIEPGDPANPLGQHLLALGGDLALHGTNPRVSTQTPQPSGGIRMAAGDIAEVYDILTIGSRIIVRK